MLRAPAESGVFVAGCSTSSTMALGSLSRRAARQSAKRACSTPIAAASPCAVAQADTGRRSAWHGWQRRCPSQPELALRRGQSCGARVRPGHAAGRCCRCAAALPRLRAPWRDIRQAWVLRVRADRFRKTRAKSIRFFGPPLRVTHSRHPAQAHLSKAEEHDRWPMRRQIMRMSEDLA